MTTAPGVVPEPAAWRSHGAAASAWGRIGAVDVVRGAALVGMAAYHLAWDLHAFALTGVDPGASVGWHLLGQAVACVFLGLSGFGLTLARARDAAPWAAMRRLLVIAAAAALVTLGTWLVAPDAVVSFGILHCIAVTNLIALGLERLGSVPLTCLAALALVGPHLGHLPGAWAWTGLSGREPATLDFRPVLPWLGPVLLGMVAARTRIVPALARLRPRGRAFAALAWAGRHSLAVYLLHQPVLILIVVALSNGSPSSPDVAQTLRTPAEASSFLRQCGDACIKGGGDSALCASTCHCVLTAAVAGAPTSTGGVAAPWLRPKSPLADAIAACRSGDLPRR